MVLGELDSNMRKNGTGPFSYTIYKNKLKYMKHLNVRQKTIKTLEEKAGNFLLDTSPKARELKAKMNYWDLSR